MMPPPEPGKSLVKRLLDLHEKLGKFGARAFQAHLEREARRRDRRERRFAKRSWTWLACMIGLLVLMVLNQHSHPEMLPGLAGLVAFGLLGYLLALLSQRRVAARDKASQMKQNLKD